MDENEEIHETIFEELKNIRIKKNLELSKIAEKTKISIKYLEAIESGNIKEIPEVYDKLFFQTYLNSLNIKKKEEYIEEFYKIRKQVRPQYTTTIQKIKSMKADSKRFSKLKQFYLLAPILIVVILIVFFAINSRSVEENEIEKVPELSVRDIANELEQQNATPIDSVKSVQNMPVSEGKKNVSVQITTLELTWMRMVKDRSDTSEYLLHPGNNLSVKAESTMVFVIGNAGGVSFKVNNKDMGPLGTSSQIVTNLKITGNGIVSKILKAMPKEKKIDSLSTD